MYESPGDLDDLDNEWPSNTLVKYLHYLSPVNILENAFIIER